jgi:uncharacterized protein (TIGR00730 family)
MFGANNQGGLSGLPDLGTLQPGLEAWRMFRIVSEFVRGFETMAPMGPAVTVFGSARVPDNHPHCEQARILGYKLAAKGFGVITGGAGGVMAGANRGAQEAGGRSCGVAITLPFEEAINPYVDPKYRLLCHYFFVRKVMFVRYAQAFVVFPGGYGTLDELFEALTLIHRHKVQPFPVYLIGTDYWRGLLEWLRTVALAEGCIEQKDLDLVTLTDDLDQVVNGIEAHYERSRSIDNL